MLILKHREDFIMRIIFIPFSILVLSSQIIMAESPYRLSWKKDGLIIGTSILAITAGSLIDDSPTELSLEDAIQLSRESVVWFDRPATYHYSTNLMDITDKLGVSTIIGPLFLLTSRQVRDDWAIFGMMYIEMMVLASYLPNIVKESVHRYRPYVYNPNLTYEEKTIKDPGKAFFSSQSTGMFASMIFLSTLFGDYYPNSKGKNYVWAGSLTLAGIVGYLRYASGLHYPSDLLVGAIAGSIIGYGIPRLHRINGQELSIYPKVDSRSLALSLQIIL
jgi:membrane-associated phospholipid phosphatase